MGIVDIACLFIARGDVGRMAVGIILKRAIEVFRRRVGEDSVAGVGYVLLVLVNVCYK
jgi:hypothetical protein